MLDRKKVIEVNGVSYPIVFNLNVMEIIQEKYGSIDAWSDKLTSDQAIADIKWSFTEMINEGIDIENETKDEKRAFVTPKQVGRIISALGTKGAIGSLFSTINDSVGADDKDPNEMTTPSEINP